MFNDAFPGIIPGALAARFVSWLSSAHISRVAKWGAALSILGQRHHIGASIRYCAQRAVVFGAKGTGQLFVAVRSLKAQVAASALFKMVCQKKPV
jgi:hypothetical protein